MTLQEVFDVANNVEIKDEFVKNIEMSNRQVIFNSILMNLYEKFPELKQRLSFENLFDRHYAVEGFITIDNERIFSVTDKGVFFETYYVQLQQNDNYFDKYLNEDIDEIVYKIKKERLYETTMYLAEKQNVLRAKIRNISDEIKEIDDQINTFNTELNQYENNYNLKHPNTDAEEDIEKY